MMFFEEVDIEDARRLLPDGLTYKYRDWDDKFHKTIITKQEVFFASAEQLHALGDKYDCYSPIDWDFSFESHRPILEKYFPGDKATMSKRDYEFSLRQFHREKAGTEYRQKQYIQNYYQLSTKLLGILSLTERNDNLKIWESELYAKDFTGFCVGFDFRKCIHKLSDSHIGGGNVIYIPHSHPKIVHRMVFNDSKEEYLQMHIEQVHRKFIDYEHEEEYRLIMRLYDKGLEYTPTISDRQFIVPKFCYKNVTFGYKMNPSAIDEIIQSCQDQYLQVDFFTATPDGAGGVQIKPYSKSTSAM